MSRQEHFMTKRRFHIFGVLALTLLLAGCDNTPPYDQEMIDLFQAQRPVFEEIRTRICEKAQREGKESAWSRSQVVMMDPEWSDPLVGDAERDRYYALFEQINAKGVQAVVPADGACKVSIAYWAVGWAGDADYKDFLFETPDQTVQIVDSLDDVRLGSEIVFYRRALEAGWWLSLDHWP
jgi:hypothetical protein